MRPSGQFLDARDPETSILCILPQPRAVPGEVREFCGNDMMWSRENTQDTPAEMRPSALSPQPGVFGFGLLKDRKVRVGVLP